MEDGGFLGGFGTFLFWFFTIFGAVIGLALIGVLVWLYLQIRMYLVLVDKVMAVTESGLRFVGIEKKLTKFGLFKMALRFLLSKKARANAIVSARGFVTTRLFTRKKGAGGAAMLEKAKRVASKNEEKLLEMAYNEAVNFAKAEAGKVLAGEPLNLAEDAKQAALSGGKELLKTAGGEALDFAQGEIRKAVAGEAPEAEKLPGGEPEGKEGKAEAIAAKDSAAEAPVAKGSALGRFLTRKKAKLAKDAKQAALSGGKELLKTAGGEALDFAQGEIRKAVAGEAPEVEKLPDGAPEGREGKAEAIAEEAAAVPEKAAKGSALGRFLMRKKAKLAKDAKQAALSGGKELLKTAGGEALDFAQGEIRKAAAGGAPEAETLPGGAPEGREEKAEPLAEKAAVAEAQGEAPAEGKAAKGSALGRFLTRKKAKLAKDAKQAALSGGKELLKTAGGEALDFAQGELRKAAAGGAPEAEKLPDGAPEGEEGKAEAIAEEAATVPENAAPNSAAEAQGEELAAGGTSPALEKICRGMERLLSQEKLDKEKLTSVVDKLLSSDLKLDIPRKQWAKWGKLAMERGAYEVAALLLEKAASEL